ncbi:MAG: GTPase HflX [Acidobacteriota bacterium]
MGVSFRQQPTWVVEEHLDELNELASSAGVEVVGRSLQKRSKPDAGTFVGRGKAGELATAADLLSADLVIFDDDLSASQVKHLERIVERQVLDRSGLILEIFVQRAQTREARTQVELARLEYLLPRLTRLWTHLSRQVGGIGVRGGEGETQLEVDRRILRQRIQRLKKDLVKIQKTRDVQRRNRRDVPLVDLAGYTNAGKSTLFYRFTRADAKVENKLFATLDSKLRRGALDSNRVAVFADTVGFIRKLPHHLVASFKSTLEEITFADVVLHVVDRSHARWREHLEVGNEVLTDLGVEAKRIVEVFNKADQVGDTVRRRDSGLWVSALTGEGVEDVKTTILATMDLLSESPGASEPSERITL